MKQALLVIDAQQELLDGKKENEEVYQKEQLIQTINNVIGKAMNLDVPILFVRDKDVASGEGKGFLVHKDINVPDDSPVFDKKATNAFYGTDLLEFLRTNEMKHLVIMGCKTEHCIDSAVRMATVQGFDVTLVKEGHSTTNSKTLNADQIIAHHNEILHGHYNVDHFSIVRSADEDVFKPIHDNYR
ncbi:isochorismatase family protein [Fictibacillus sp. WQ 8-8]|uniref:isochorismatase family protein n=1 Tax=unclassified Fictibacillus TaxID=2644029 RepID=UPI0008E6B12A|nr:MULTISPECIES: isochorismatase family protein [unclassified Fictibacillus]MCQ6265302.1 isochorismatase family protein [Fictibacillus sp. WQ 8-8]MED2971974.1 isochorismatase family protein [Fictibacillus sp. B-59209]SFE01781.1 Nicotinamidase-related amidase [Bacillus sp. OV194]